MIYITIIIAIFIADAIIKKKIETIPEENNFKKACAGFLNIGKHHNRGAFLSVGSKVRPLVAFISLLFTIAMFLFFCATLSMKGNNLLKLGLSLMLGGAFSNTYDRLKRKYVVDYLIIGKISPRKRSVIYNISDFFIAIGAVLLVISGL